MWQRPSSLRCSNAKGRASRSRRPVRQGPGHRGSIRLIQEGKADIMIAGGSEAALNFMGFVGFVLIHALVEKYSTPRKGVQAF